jgi:hypothetical protein
VIVLDEHHRILRVSDLFDHRCRKLAIHILIGLPISRAKDRASVRDMRKWPKTLIGKSVIVSFFFLLSQPYPPQCVVRVLRRNAQPIIFVHNFSIGISAAVRNPCSIAGGENRL